MKCDQARTNSRGHHRRAKATDSEIYFSRVRKPGIRDRKVNAPPQYARSDYLLEMCVRASRACGTCAFHACARASMHVPAGG